MSGSIPSIPSGTSSLPSVGGSSPVQSSGDVPQATPSQSDLPDLTMTLKNWLLGGSVGITLVPDTPLRISLPFGNKIGEIRTGEDVIHISLEITRPAVDTMLFVEEFHSTPEGKLKRWSARHWSDYPKDGPCLALTHANGKPVGALCFSLLGGRGGHEVEIRYLSHAKFLSIINSWREFVPQISETKPLATEPFATSYAVESEGPGPLTRAWSWAVRRSRAFFGRGPDDPTATTGGTGGATNITGFSPSGEVSRISGTSGASFRSMLTTPAPLIAGGMSMTQPFINLAPMLPQPTPFFWMNPLTVQ